MKCLTFSYHIGHITLDVFYIKKGYFFLHTHTLSFFSPPLSLTLEMAAGTEWLTAAILDSRQNIKVALFRLRGVSMSNSGVPRKGSDSHESAGSGEHSTGVALEI